MNQPDPRLSESLPAVPVRPADRETLARGRSVLTREAPNIEKIALALALQTFRRVDDLPKQDQMNALYLQAEALRRAAELVEERTRIMEGKGRA